MPPTTIWLYPALWITFIRCTENCTISEQALNPEPGLTSNLEAQFNAGFESNSVNVPL
jgi:hypothetical protein